MNTKNMIKELKEEIDKLDLKIITINSIIGELESLDGKEEEEVKEKFLMDVVPKVKSDAWKKKPGPQKGTKSTQESQLYDSGVKKKVNNEILEFIRDNCLEKDDKTLVKDIKKQFGVGTKVNTIKYWMSQNGISRRRLRKEATGEQPEEKKSPTIFPLEMEEFVKNNLSLSNKDLANKVNIQFDLDMDNKNISDYMRQRKIKRNYTQIAKVLKKKEQPEEEKIDKRKISKYPDGMKGFIERHMETNSNQQLCDLINEKWDVNIDKVKLNSYLTYNKLKRVNRIRSPRVGKPKKYTDEVMQFLKENINNFKNRELCEELESRFNVKVSEPSLVNTMSKAGIKRDIQPEVEPEIEDFILQSKIKDAYILKDKIIEKFEKDIPTRKIINIMNKRTKDLPGESVKEEVDRIEAKRTKNQRDPFDDEVDELDLDN